MANDLPPLDSAPLTYGGVKPMADDPITNARRVTLQSMAAAVEACNRDNGWFDSEVSVGDLCALLHSEISEAFDAWRKHGFADTTETRPHLWDAAHCARCGADRGEAYMRNDMTCGVPKPEGYGSELADVLIRLLDQATRHGVDLAGEFTRKMAYNRTRGYRHGGRRA